MFSLKSDPLKEDSEDYFERSEGSASPHGTDLSKMLSVKSNNKISCSILQKSYKLEPDLFLFCSQIDHWTNQFTFILNYRLWQFLTLLGL